MKPYSQACENNKVPILNEIRSLFQSCSTVFEIGSGTGQHAVYFAEMMPGLHWHTSDQVENHDGIRQWLEESGLVNIELPINLDVTGNNWPTEKFDAVFTANTCHIMHWHEVIAMFAAVKNILLSNGLFVIYGPFNYDNKFTSESNARFEQWLKSRDPKSGIRNLEDLMLLAGENELELMDDIAMPANNRLLVLKRV